MNNALGWREKLLGLLREENGCRDKRMYLGATYIQTVLLVSSGREDITLRIRAVNIRINKEI